MDDSVPWLGDALVSAESALKLHLDPANSGLFAISAHVTDKISFHFVVTDTYADYYDSQYAADAEESQTFSKPASFLWN